MSSPLEGTCPSCRDRGAVGLPCPERACARQGIHFVPTSELPRDERARIDPEIGRLVDQRYLLVRLLGEGGFGRVFAALQQPLGMRVALKVLKPDRDETGHEGRMRLFRLEAQAMAQLQHPNIVKIVDFGFMDGAAYLVMELIEGATTLKDELRRREREGRSVSLDEVAAILTGVLSALEKAHAKKIVHRDVKPENIMLQAEPGHPLLPRLLDFGLAKFVDEDTQSSAVLGTPSYMAPEQLTKSDPGPWTDLYALGVVAYELMTGRRPFRGEVGQIVADKRNPGFDVLAAVADLDVPTPIASFLRKALAFDVSARFQDAAAFRRALLDALAAASSSSRADLQQIDVSAIAPTPTPRRAEPPAPPPVAPRDDEVDPTLDNAALVFDATPPKRLTGRGAALPSAEAPGPNRKARALLLRASLVGTAVVAAGVWFAISPGTPSEGTTPHEAATSAPSEVSRQTSPSPTATAEVVPVGEAATQDEGAVDAAIQLERPPWEDASALEAFCRRSLERAKAARDVFHRDAAGACERPDALGRCEVVVAFDRVLREIDTASGLSMAIQVGSASAAAKNAAAYCTSDIMRFGVELAADKKVLAPLRKLASRETDVNRRFVELVLMSFASSGILSDEKNVGPVRDVQQRLAELDRRYFDHLARSNVTLTVSRPEAVLPAKVLARMPRDASGGALISLDDGTAELFLAHASDAKLREQLIQTILQRASPANDAVARDLLVARRQLAGLIGLPDAAALDLTPTMGRTADRVSAFLDSLRTQLAPALTRELTAMRAEAKRRRLSGSIPQGDRTFLLERLREAVDVPADPRLFMASALRDAALERLGQMLGLVIEPSSASAWHPSVKVYDVRDAATETSLGRMFLDVYMREGKPPGFARVLPIQTGLEGGRASWVAVFAGQPDPSNGALLTLAEATSFLEQLGEAVFRMVTESRSPLIGLGPERMEPDARQGLSYLLALLARPPDVLAAAVAGNAEGRQPEALVASWLAREEVGRAYELGRLAFLATYLLGLHQQDPATLDLVQYTKQAYAKWHPMGDEHTDEALFAHLPQLVQYRAAFFAVLWREALALELLAAVDRSPDGEKAAWARLRERVLERVGAQDPTVVVNAFLGRNLDFRDFFASFEALGNSAPAEASPTAERQPERAVVAEQVARPDAGTLPDRSSREVVGGESCDESAVRKVVQRRATAFRSCYEQRLSARPGLGGKVTLTWNIGGDGSVRGARVSSNSTGDEELAACLVRTLERLRFEPAGDCRVNYPFLFAAQ